MSEIVVFFTKGGMGNICYCCFVCLCPEAACFIKFVEITNCVVSCFLCESEEKKKERKEKLKKEEEKAKKKKKKEKDKKKKKKKKKKSKSKAKGRPYFGVKLIDIAKEFQGEEYETLITSITTSKIYKQQTKYDLLQNKDEFNEEEHKERDERYKEYLNLQNLHTAQQQRPQFHTTEAKAALKLRDICQEVEWREKVTQEREWVRYFSELAQQLIAIATPPDLVGGAIDAAQKATEISHLSSLITSILSSSSSSSEHSTSLVEETHTPSSTDSSSSSSSSFSSSNVASVYVTSDRKTLFASVCKIAVTISALQLLNDVDRMNIEADERLRAVRRFVVRLQTDRLAYSLSLMMHFLEESPELAEYVDVIVPDRFYAFGMRYFGDLMMKKNDSEGEEEEEEEDEEKWGETLRLPPDMLDRMRNHYRFIYHVVHKATRRVVPRITLLQNDHLQMNGGDDDDLMNEYECSYFIDDGTIGDDDDDGEELRDDDDDNDKNNRIREDYAVVYDYLF